MQVRHPACDLPRPLELRRPGRMLRVRDGAPRVHLLRVRLREVREHVLERAVRREWGEEAAQAARAVDDDGGYLDHARRGPLDEDVELQQHVFHVPRALFEGVVASVPRHAVHVRAEARRTELREHADLHGRDAGQRRRDERVRDDLLGLFAERVRRVFSICMGTQCDASGGGEEVGDGGDGALEGLEQGALAESARVVLEQCVLQRTRYA